MSAAVVFLAECRAVLGGERDRFRAVWDEKTTPKDRRLLLAMAGCSMTTAARCIGLCWSDLKPELRGEIKRGLARFKGWAELLEGAA